MYDLGVFAGIIALPVVLRQTDGHLYIRVVWNLWQVAGTMSMSMIVISFLSLFLLLFRLRSVSPEGSWQSLTGPGGR